MTVRVSSSTARAFGVEGVKRAHKYGAVRVKDDGYTFDSKAEHKRYCELKMLQRAGEIAELQVHPRYPLDVKGQRIALYEADFSYRDKAIVRLGGTAHAYFALVVLDVKGVATAEFKLKAALFRVLYPDFDFRVEAA